VEVVGADLNFSFIPHSWVVLRRLDDPQHVERILRSPADPPLWPGQPVLLHVGSGFLRLPWVAQIAVDDVRQSLATLKHSPGAAEPLKTLIRGYAMRSDMAQTVAATLEYERLHPADHEYPERIALGLGMAGDCASMYRLLEPFIGRRTDYEFFTHLGYALGCLKRRDEAMKYLEKAVALEPENWWAYYHIGYMLYDAQKFEQAEPYLAKVLASRHIPDVARDIGSIQRIVALKRARETGQPPRSP
jgi:tetratricopeptide (TPR) repeat protein